MPILTQPPADAIGPFNPAKHGNPVRRGLYLRRLPKTGTLAYAYFDPSGDWDRGQWGLASTNKRRAMQRRHKPSKHDNLPWYGRVKT